MEERRRQLLDRERQLLDRREAQLLLTEANSEARTSPGSSGSQQPADLAQSAPVQEGGQSRRVRWDPSLSWREAGAQRSADQGDLRSSRTTDDSAVPPPAPIVSSAGQWHVSATVHAVPDEAPNASGEQGSSASAGVTSSASGVLTASAEASGKGQASVSLGGEMRAPSGLGSRGRAPLPRPLRRRDPSN